LAKQPVSLSYHKRMQEPEALLEPEEPFLLEGSFLAVALLLAAALLAQPEGMLEPYVFRGIRNSALGQGLVPVDKRAFSMEPDGHNVIAVIWEQAEAMPEYVSIHFRL
jgi:hypothetical protein